MKRYLLSLAFLAIATINANAQHKPHLVKGDVTTRILDNLHNPKTKNHKTVDTNKTVYIYIIGATYSPLPATMRHNAEIGYVAVANGKVIGTYKSVDRATLYSLQWQANNTQLPITLYRNDSVIETINPK